MLGPLGILCCRSNWHVWWGLLVKGIWSVLVKSPQYSGAPGKCDGCSHSLYRIRFTCANKAEKDTVTFMIGSA